MTTLKYGLNVRKKPADGPSRPAPARQKPVFGDDDSDEDEPPKKRSNEEEIDVFDLDAPSKLTTPPNDSAKLPPKKSAKGKPQISQHGDLSTLKTQRKHIEKATALDPSIYDYDAAYDALHAKSAAKEAAERADAEQRKPKYMSNLLEAAEVRKRDQLRAKDAMLQKEREEEGEEFADKEKFVTGAYKEQQEEVQRLAAEEEKRKEQEEARRRTGQGLQSFRRNMLDVDDRKHQDAVAAIDEAASKGVISPVESAPEEKTDAELARELNARGKNVIINEEGQVADKRQLLTAGLNVAPKPKAAASTAPAARNGLPQHTYQGRGSSQMAMRERQTRMLEAQLEQATKRTADEEAEAQRKVEHASKSRKTESEVSSARERYLQRKREAAAASNNG